MSKATISINRLLTLLVIHSLLFWTDNASAYETIQFRSDERQQEIEVSDRACSVLLDDNSNYSVVALTDHSFMVKTKAESERSALLVISCEKQTYPYGLSFKNGDANSAEASRYKPALKRPNSSVGYLYGNGAGQAPTTSIDITDQSYRGLGVTARRDYQELTHPKIHRDSLDIVHAWGEDYEFGYGGSKGLTRVGNKTLKKSDLRLRGGGLGLNLSVQKSQLENDLDDDNLTIMTPSPVSLRLRYHRNRDLTVEKSVERNFFGNKGALTAYLNLIHTQTSRVHTSEIEPKTDISQSLTYSKWPWIIPQLESGCFLRHGEQGKLDEFKTSTQLRYKASYSTLGYGLVPHSGNATIGHVFPDRHEVRLSFNRRFADLPWVTSRNWIVSGGRATDLQAKAFTKLAYERDAYSGFVEHDIPITHEESTNSIFARVGARYDIEKVSSSLTFSFPYSRVQSGSVLFDIRYYFDRNIGQILQRLEKHQITGRVRSNLAGRAIAGVTVAFTTEGRSLGSVTTDAEGRYALEDAPASGKIVITATQGKFVSTKSIDKRVDNPKTASDLEIEDHVSIEVKWLLDVDGTRDFSGKDETISSLTNFIKETGEGIVSVNGAAYEGNTIWVKKSTDVKFEPHSELLPFEYEFIKLSKPAPDLGEKGGTIEVLLRKKS